MRNATTSFTIKISYRSALCGMQKNRTTKKKCKEGHRNDFWKHRNSYIVIRKKWIYCIGSKGSVNRMQITIGVALNGFAVGLQCIMHKSKQHTCLLAHPGYTEKARSTTWECGTLLSQCNKIIEVKAKNKITQQAEKNHRKSVLVDPFCIGDRWCVSLCAHPQVLQSLHSRSPPSRRWWDMKF